MSLLGREAVLIESEGLALASFLRPVYKHPLVVRAIEEIFHAWSV